MTSRKKIILSMVVIMVAVAATVGGTFAWFTAEEEVTNTFVAGTVLFNLDESMTSDSEVATEGFHAPNVNPGDCYNKKLEITNTGTKYILLRMNFTDESWLINVQFLLDNEDALGFTDTQVTQLEELKGDGGGLDENGYATLAAVKGLDDFTGLGDPVIWSDIEAQLVDAGWIYNTETEYWYYDGALSGAYPTGEDGGSIPDFDFDVCFDGATMNNVFQASEYSMTIRVQAIQASNNASGLSDWNVDSWYYLNPLDEADSDTPSVPTEPDEPDLNRSGSNWAGWGFNQ